jgi:molecular chaperone DnaK
MADTLSYTTEKAIKDAGDKLTAEEKQPVEDAITNLNSVKNGDDLEAIKKATEDLSTKAQAIGQKLYAATQAEGAAPEGGEATGEPEAKDAEVETDASHSDDSHSEAGTAEDGAPVEGEAK